MLQFFSIAQDFENLENKKKFIDSQIKEMYRDKTLLRERLEHALDHDLISYEHYKLYLKELKNV